MGNKERILEKPIRSRKSAGRQSSHCHSLFFEPEVFIAAIIYFCCRHPSPFAIA